MKIIITTTRLSVRIIRIRRKRWRLQMRRSLLKIKAGLAQEKDETRQMLAIYRRYTKRQATREEMKLANSQLRDLLKGLGLGVFAVLPFAPVTIPLVVKLGRVFGIEVLPSAFNPDRNKEKPNNPPRSQ